MRDQYEKQLKHLKAELVRMGELCEKAIGEAARALEALAHLQGCQAHCSVILSPADEGTYRKLGIQLTCEPKYQTNKLYHR